MGKGREVFFNVSKCFFTVFVKISSFSNFKKFKTNILTIVIERKAIMMKTFLGNISVQK